MKTPGLLVLEQYMTENHKATLYRPISYSTLTLTPKTNHPLNLSDACFNEPLQLLLATVSQETKATLLPCSS